MDRLKKLLAATHQVSDRSDKDDRGSQTREQERSMLNTADARFNKQVYQNEIKQANLYDQSEMPPTPQDVGVSFKIGSFVNKLSQLLSFKTDLFGQFQALVNLGTSPSRLTTDSRLISVSTDYFKTPEIIATYNELCNYISLYAPQMRASSDFASGVNTTYLLPLIALLRQTAQLYLSGFNQFPTPKAGNAQDQAAYDRMKTSSANVYSTLLLMASNLENAIYTPIRKRDIDRFAVNQQVLGRVFTRNPLPVAPAIDPLIAAQQAAAAAAAAAQQGQQGQQQPGSQPGSPQAGPAPQPVSPGTGRGLLQADMSLVLEAIAAQARADSRVPYVGESTLVYNRTDFGQRQPVLRAKDVVAQVIGDVREALGLARNTKISQKNNQVASAVFNTNDPFFQGLAAGQPPQALLDTAGFLNRVRQAPASPVVQPGSPQQQPVSPVVQPVSPVVQPGSPGQGQQVQPGSPQQQQPGSPQQQQPGGAPAQGMQDFSSLRDIPAIANGGANVQAIAQTIISLERSNGGIFDDADPKDLSKVLSVIKTQQPQLYATLRREGTPDVIDDAEIMNTEIGPVMRQIKMYKDDIIQRGNYQGTPYLSAAALYGLGQRSHLEERKREAELARGNPRVVDMSQGRRKRETDMPFIMEFDPKAEFLKRGQIMSGGYEIPFINHNMDYQMPYEMYGGNDGEIDEENTPFKRRIGMPNPFAPSQAIPVVRPTLASNATDVDQTLEQYRDIFGLSRQSHEAEQAKPVDLDENPDPIRITNENYKIFTGKQKAPKYKIFS
jgi:hypothetical protein